MAAGRATSWVIGSGTSRRRRLMIHVALLFFAPSLTRAAIAAPVVLNGEDVSDFIGLGVESFMDPSGKMTLDQVTNASFQASDRKIPTFGQPVGAVWLRFNLLRGAKAPEHYLLALENPSLDTVDLYSPSPTGVQVQHAGAHLSLNERAVHHRHMVFKLAVAAGQPQTYYLQVITGGGFGYLPMRVFQPSALAAEAEGDLAAYGVYLGLGLLLIALNLFLYAMLRDNSSLLYALSLFGILWGIAASEGLTARFLFPSLRDAFMYDNVLSGAVAMATIIQASRRFLESAKYARRVDRFLRVTIVLFLSLAVVACFEPIFAGDCTLVLVPFVLVGVVLAGVPQVRRRDKPAILFLGGWASVLLAGNLSVAASMGFAPFALLHATEVGSALEMLLFTSAISLRLYTMSQEKLAVQAQALATQTLMAEAFSRFVPKEFLAYLQLRNLAEVRLGDQVQTEMTVLFSDIRDFTTLSESMSPAQTFAFVNAHLSRVGPIIRQHGGFIDKYIGDAVMALFSRADDAVRAAIEMQRAVAAGNVGAIQQVAIGVGVHTGTLMLGIVGEDQRLQGTVIADAVNLASRIEGQTKAFGVRVLISAETRHSLAKPDEFTLQFLGEVQVKGKAQAVTLYQARVDEEVLAASRGPSVTT